MNGGNSCEDIISMDTITVYPSFSLLFMAVPTLLTPFGATIVEDALWNCENVSLAAITICRSSFLNLLWICEAPAIASSLQLHGILCETADFRMQKQKY